LPAVGIAKELPESEEVFVCAAVSKRLRLGREGAIMQASVSVRAALPEKAKESAPGRYRKSRTDPVITQAWLTRACTLTGGILPLKWRYLRWRRIPLWRPSRVPPPAGKAQAVSGCRGLFGPWYPACAASAKHQVRM